MPLIKIQTSLKSIDDSDKFLTALSSELAKSTGKPESYVMTILQTNIPMTFGGSNDPSCFIEIKSIGSLKPAEMSKSFCSLVSRATNIPSNRIYIAFEDVSPSKWGFNGNTFG
ncbi:phenylpyruvate tautomerase MIF-related protein [Prochlorococcus sp. MIT 1223]|uniref:phenylpyruvate tautomerase MIF-related protein n=1 Tax=Prochlorococcus sp. MIT 1223 TaxID=3096217 RepID=UPI002A753E14|nr:phenylpyruvate tautomerase MIF-related protein [Prochlorococcus sp. MIT 1223]